ncbi:MAG: efflux RND transporter periplasmic adaptor subunit, partial [Planctomycetales bacterium]|nr:efflux RND transporter periplasmic adaptor subunit [Planctomycetales bacterium]
LSPQKVDSSGVKVGAVHAVRWQATRTISGRLDYDRDRHVDVKSACDGILAEMLVHPGDRVSAGQVVAVISSPEVGMARAEVRSRLDALDLAVAGQQWHGAICQGVASLSEMIEAGRSPDEIRRSLQDDSLGAYREKLVSAYTHALLSRRVAENSKDAAARGAIASSVQQQRESQVQSAEAALESVLEQSHFETEQQCKEATAQAERAQRLVDIALQQLNRLLGPAAAPATAAQFRQPEGDGLSQVDLISPIDGTVEERLLSASERVQAGEAVYTIADVSRLWAVADIRERDWEAISVAPGEVVEISSPAIPGGQFSGQVLIVGRRYDPLTGAAPLIAQLQGSDPRLRPGLFIRMTVPIAPPREVLAVPEQAVVVHDGQSFVFVAENEHLFHRVDVVTGENEKGLTEIRSGLKQGQSIAVEGVFKLKSELLLAGEEE